MYISLRWVVDHLENSSFKSLDVEALVAAFNAKVAEIEQVMTVSLPIDSFMAVRVSAHDASGITVNAPESKQTYTLSTRTDLDAHPSAAYLIDLSGAQPAWVTLRQLGLDKDGLLPAVHLTDEQLAGSWRAQWEADDIIFDVDNKSITHRPDMWGHRGFAREIGALLGATLKDEKPLLANVPVVYEPAGVTASEQHTCSLHNKAPETCSALSGVVLPAVAHLPSDLRAVSRFVKVGYRPINALVDLTNYVMGEWGHPMHAYDAARIPDKTLSVRMAREGEQLTLLDDAVLDLSIDDMVITTPRHLVPDQARGDGYTEPHTRHPELVSGSTEKNGPRTKPGVTIYKSGMTEDDTVVGLAGIMGGKDDSVGADTSSVLLEAACFHAATIRRSAARHKLRTESSQRFEKTLDAAMAPQVLQRFMQLAVAWGVLEAVPSVTISVVGEEPGHSIITLSQNYLTDRLGFTVSPEQVAQFLTRLAFGVEIEKNGDAVVYHVSVPTYRATKDVTGPHDIVEEVARQYGFDNIEPQMPALPARASHLRPVLTVRRLKEYLAFGAGMREQRNYAFFDEHVLKMLGWQSAQKLALQNPVAQHAHRMVDSLVPHLLHNVHENSADVDSCAFFEWGTVWPNGTERYELAGVWYEKRGGLNFYELKEKVAGVCGIARVPVTMRKSASVPAWLDSTRTADVYHNDEHIGLFGRVHPVMVQRLGGLPETEVYAFTLNGSYLQSMKPPVFHAGREQRYQHSTFDVSVLIPRAVTVAELEQHLAACSDLITNVRLIDFFEKNEWTEHRSVALRVTLAHHERTVSREEIEQVRQDVIAALEKHGGTLRA